MVRPRLEAVDALRGLVMILMALDHTRDFFGVPGENPTNLATASAALFMTRWVTHFCAPVFFLLAGTAACLSLQRRSRAQLSRFLLTRGLWLIFLELVLVRCLVYQFNVDYRVTLLLVLWALGWSMIALSALVHLPVTAVTAFGIALIGGHNLFDTVPLSTPLWTILHAQNFVVNRPDHVVFVAYPLIPWIGVTAAGFGLGEIYGWPADRRRAWLVRLGLGLTTAFLVLRSLDHYGDPSHWTPQTSAMFTVLSFLNTTKYPPSLQFLLMTLGPALLLLAAADRGIPRLLRPALVIGRVPLFYYVGHFLLLHLLAVAVCWARYGSAHWMFESPDLAHYPFTAPPGWGFSLPVVYAVWAGVVLAMYPFTQWFGRLKQRRHEAWLSYF
ncbi:MAG TPA: heparan-alpha-glucosaminide N-acetyltransferase domain-containing protein [Vicinamibacterales bacterium]|nr:heparan-alpha-glucosaminide N-acetyltransferase domain-containing protein [Vicinamibacterales bacterium]